MNKISEKIKKTNKSSYIGCVLIIFFFMLSILSMFLAYENLYGNIQFRNYLICVLFAQLLLVAGHVCFYANHSEKTLNQLLVIDLSVCISCVLVFCTSFPESNLSDYQRFYDFLWVYILVEGALSICGICFRMKDFRIYVWLIKVKQWFTANKYLVILLLGAVILYFFEWGIEPRWDGGNLYQNIDAGSPKMLFDIKALSFCKHISMAYMAINKGLGIIIGNTYIGMAIGNAFLYLLSIRCVYGILKKIVKNKSEWGNILLTFIYVVSPFVWGQVGYNYWDFWTTCLYPILIFYALEKKWVYHCFFAFVFCFTKETAVIAYAGYGAGLLLYDLAAEIKLEGVKKALARIVKKKHYWTMIALGITWFAVYKARPHWDGGGTFVVDIAYIWEKCKVLFIINFNWILTVFAIVFLVSLAKKSNETKAIILPILVGDFLFVIFSCIFETYNHARYIDSHVAVLSILGTCGIACISQVIIRRVICVILLVLLVLQNFITIDPLTRVSFSNFKVGSQMMVSTCQEEYLTDSMVYNQQYRYFDAALSRALMQAVHEENTVNFFPILGNTAWCFGGLYITDCLDQEITNYWSEEKQRRVIVEDNSSISFPIYNINVNSDIDELLGDKTGYFYYIPCLGLDIADKIKQNEEVIRTEEFNVMGWSVTRICFRVKK